MNNESTTIIAQTESVETTESTGSNDKKKTTKRSWFGLTRGILSGRKATQRVRNKNNEKKNKKKKEEEIEEIEG